MTYRQLTDIGNIEFRDQWVAQALRRCRPGAGETTLLDVGAGASPYRSTAKELGYAYRSHGFSAYVPSEASPGLQDDTWDYPEHDFVCDITAIPDDAASDVLLCTEVLEHVPDPVRAFERMVQLVKPGGWVIVTVPFLSLMHQSPYWFQSGLSPFWFEHWAAETGIEVDELTVQGDYADLMSQEVARLLRFKRRIPGLGRAGGATARRLRPLLSPDVLQSGGLGTLFIGSKPEAS
jgi:hypothetical protein